MFKPKVLTSDQKHFLSRVVRQIARQRTDAGYNKSELARISGMTVSSYTRLEQGESRVLLSDLYLIAKALNISISELLPKGS